MNVARLITVLLIAVVTVTARAEEARVKLHSTVVGNQEQPKVLYIVPWQPAQMPKLVYQPLQSLVDGVFENIDREEFVRELDYRQKVAHSPRSGQ